MTFESSKVAMITIYVPVTELQGAALRVNAQTVRVLKVDCIIRRFY